MGIVWVDRHQPLATEYRGAVVTIGNFDGVHLGHAKLISTCCQLRDKLNSEVGISRKVKSLAITFNDHPMTLVSPENSPRKITTFLQKCQYLLQFGVDSVMVLDIHEDWLSISATDFCEQILGDLFDVRGIVEGPNFRFGNRRIGDLKLLNEWSNQRRVPCLEVPSAICQDQIIISSSRIRQAIETGEVDIAAMMLGRSYEIRGKVVPGQKRGRTLGFPTANLNDIETILPAPGIYAVEVEWNGQFYRGAANIGNNPTFSEKEMKVEIHLLDFSGDLYGQTVRVLWLKKIRDLITFPSKEALIQQISSDIQNIRAIIGKSRHSSS